jgi:hypothetical protein
VRTCYNPILVDDLRAGRTSQSTGTAMVKEIHAGGTGEVRGYSVMIKTRADSGSNGEGWLFFETFDLTGGPPTTVAGSACARTATRRAPTTSSPRSVRSSAASARPCAECDPEAPFVGCACAWLERVCKVLGVGTIHLMDRSRRTTTRARAGLGTTPNRKGIALTVSTEGRLEAKAIHWLAARLPACDAIARTASESLERRLTPRERAQRRLHFLVCGLCSRYEERIRMLRKTVRD